MRTRYERDKPPSRPPVELVGRVHYQSQEASRQTGMKMYQHFSAAELEFILQGELTGDGVQEVQHAWVTASSVQAGKELIVDISGITNADAGGFELLSRMRASGARLIAALPAASEDFLRSLGVAAPAPRQPGRWPWSLRVLRRAGLFSS